MRHGRQISEPLWLVQNLSSEEDVGEMGETRERRASRHRLAARPASVRGRVLRAAKKASEAVTPIG